MPRDLHLASIFHAAIVLAVVGISAVANAEAPVCSVNMVEKVLTPTYAHPAHQLCMKDAGMSSKVFLSASFSPSLTQLGAFFKSESCRTTFQLIADAVKNDLPNCMYTSTLSSKQLGSLTFDHLKTLYTAYVESL